MRVRFFEFSPVFDEIWSAHQLFSFGANIDNSGYQVELWFAKIERDVIARGVFTSVPDLKRKLLIVWDGAAQHKSRIVREYLDSTKGAMQMALLPSYSPDLNPVEYLWAWLKRHALANFCPRSLAELKITARSKLRSGQRRQSIITACWKQAELW